MTPEQEAAEAVAIFRRARELVVETADMEGNQHRMLAFALILSQFELTRRAGNEASRALQDDDFLGKLLKDLRINFKEVAPHELPPDPLISMMRPKILEWCQTDLRFASAMFLSVWRIARETPDTKYPGF